jgi:hypothetical protein
VRRRAVQRQNAWTIGIPRRTLLQEGDEVHRPLALVADPVREATPVWPPCWLPTERWPTQRGSRTTQAFCYPRDFRAAPSHELTRCRHLGEAVIAVRADRGPRFCSVLMHIPSVLPHEGKVPRSAPVQSASLGREVQQTGTAVGGDAPTARVALVENPANVVEVGVRP